MQEAGETVHSTVHVDAAPEVVFDFFTLSDAVARWLGDNAVLDPRPGGTFSVDRYGVAIRGAFVALDRARRVTLTWGHEGSERLPPGASTVEVALTDTGGGTLVEIRHAGLPLEDAGEQARDWAHVLVRLRVAATGTDPGLDPWAGLPGTRKTV